MRYAAVALPLLLYIHIYLYVHRAYYGLVPMFLLQHCVVLGVSVLCGRFLDVPAFLMAGRHVQVWYMLILHCNMVEDHNCVVPQPLQHCNMRCTFLRRAACTCACNCQFACLPGRAFCCRHHKGDIGTAPCCNSTRARAMRHGTARLQHML